MFKDLFEYNHQVNQKLIALLSVHRSTLSERTIQWINHLLNAHQIWNARILDEPAFAVWKINNWEDLPELDRQNYLKSVRIVHELDGEGVITYKNSSGTGFSDKVKDILFHTINHSTYHRAQIALLLREGGIDPINTDYIFYKRQGP